VGKKGDSRPSAHSSDQDLRGRRWLTMIRRGFCVRTNGSLWRADDVKRRAVRDLTQRGRRPRA